MVEFYRDEYRATVEKAKRMQGFSYLFITDMHIDYRDSAAGVLRQCETAVSLADEVGADCIVLGGDIVHGCSSHDATIDWFRRYAEIFASAHCPTFVARGNHDENPYHSRGEKNKTVPPEYLITPAEWCAELLDRESLTRGMLVHDRADPLSAYYTVDMPGRQTRLIFLDPFDHPADVSDGYMTWVSESWNRVSAQQMRWFAAALGAIPDGWRCLLFCHGAVYRLNEAPFINAADVRALLAAFNGKRTCTLDAYGIEADYRQTKTRIPLCHFGHTHVDGSGIDPESGILYLNTGHAKTKPDYVNNGGVTRVDGTVSEALFDLVVCTDEGTVERIRFGAGVDESFVLPL